MVEMTEDDVDEDTTPVNSGWGHTTTIGASANILLNPLDDRGARSLRSLGLGYIYLSPYVEFLTRLYSEEKEAVVFARQVWGIGFTFESVR